MWSVGFEWEKNGRRTGKTKDTRGIMYSICIELNLRVRPTMRMISTIMNDDTNPKLWIKRS